MGYSTNYELSVYEGDKNIKEILNENPEFEGLGYALYEDGSSCEGVKWYQHEIDMKELSEKYPEIVFKLEGEGEEGGDIWIKYFKGGKMQECYARIEFDEYNENELR